VLTLVLRLWGIKQGLPYSYNVDEATHFVPRAVSFFSQGLDPHYFLNPPAYSYLLHIVFELWFGSADAVTRAYTTNPTEVFVVARVVAAVLGTLSVLLTYLAGARFFNRTVGLLAAAIFGLGFLPIFYSHLALNDVPTLAPVALSLYGIAGVMRRGRRRDYLIAGVGVGLAAATKYTGGITYYIWTFSWGFGLAPALAALGGAGLLLARRRLAMALVLLPGPIAFIVFMGDQQRFFGRWLMPIFPIVAILAAYGAIELIRWLARARRIPAPLAGAAAVVLLLTQGLVSVLHNDAVLARPDTRNLTRAWMVGHVPAGAKVVIEPVVPDNWASDVGVSLPWTRTGERWDRWPTWLSSVDNQGNPLPAGQHRFVLVDQYERSLRPELLDQYVNQGFCWVVIGSLQAGRAFAQPQDAPGAVAYYAALANRARLVYHVSPFSTGSNPVPFSFDWSIDYYPRQYHRPGPEMSVYRLSGGKCT
jgi:Dolichyl-phosphate-mannose-protein mannosyltransferase